MKRILIVDDHQVVRDGLKAIIEELSRYIVFGEAATAEEALRLLKQHDWDLIVLDLSLTEASGLEVLVQIKHVRSRVPVLVLTMHTEKQYARRAFKAGAVGYVTKDSARAEIMTAVSQVIQGGRYLSPSLAESLVTDLDEGTDWPTHETLSNREFEVMRLIASGKTATEIATLLSLSANTVSTYRARILEKMAMKTNAELTLYAIQKKLVE